MAENKKPKLISMDRNNPRRAGKACEFMSYSGKEAFKRFRTNILIALGENEDKTCRIIGVTSAQPSEGKSTVSVNLAYTLAELGKSVMVIDGDMRRPTIHNIMGAKLAPGVSDILTGKVGLNESIVRYKSTEGDISFDLLPSGEIPDHPAELLNSSRFGKLLEVVSRVFDYVIVDLPPVNAVVDAVNVSKYVDGMVIVVHEGHCPRFVLKDCVEQLRYAKANILGFVLNGCVDGAGKHYQYKRQYYSYYGK